MRTEARKELVEELAMTIAVSVMNGLSKGTVLSPDAIDCWGDIEQKVRDIVYPILDAALATMIAIWEE